MLTRKDWQNFKKKNKIGDGMAKVSIGEQIDKFHKSKGDINDLNTLKLAFDLYLKAIAKAKYYSTVKNLFETNYDDISENLPVRIGQCFTRMKLANAEAEKTSEKLNKYFDRIAGGDEAGLKWLAAQLEGLLRDYAAVYGHQKKNPIIQHMHLVAQRAFTANSVKGDPDTIAAIQRNMESGIAELGKIEREYEAFAKRLGII